MDTTRTPSSPHCKTQASTSSATSACAAACAAHSTPSPTASVCKRASESLASPTCTRKELAPTKEIRALQFAADDAQHVAKRQRDTLSPVFADAYREQILADFSPSDFLAELPPDTQAVVFFCVERAPEACHRSLVADEDRRRAGPRSGAHPMRVLIVAKTRMGSGACVGAISTTGQSLRLIPDGGYSDGAFNLEYEIGDVWELDEYEFPPAQELIPPHIENVIVRRKRRDRHYDKPASIIDQIMSPHSGGLDVLFDGLTQTSHSGSLYIAERTGVPTYSTMFWRPDKPLTLDDSGKRLHYCYPLPNGGAKLAFVGFQEPVDEIPAGTLVRVSLAHWWRPEDAGDDVELRCHCQFSGWFSQAVTSRTTA